ncbi:MAG: rhombosortase [Gammaproteobacteria bacterium]|nr:rhombosortase [Gammaproteobacteria bacterium]
MGSGQVQGGASSMLRGGLLPACMAAASLLVELAGNAGRQALRFERSAVQAGEAWRLLTGHFAHLGWRHLLLNLAGLLLVWLLVGQRFDRRQWLVVIALTVLGIDLGFWLLDPDLDWYVGLSGLLHGVLVAGLAARIGDGSREALILLLIIVGKLLWEQLIGPMPGSESLAGDSVVVNAHLYGAIAGGLAGMMVIRVRSARPI